MSSENYRKLLNNEYKNQELSTDDFDNTLMHFAKLYHTEQLQLGAVVGQSQADVSESGEPVREGRICGKCGVLLTFTEKMLGGCLLCQEKIKQTGR